MNHQDQVSAIHTLCKKLIDQIIEGKESEATATHNEIQKLGINKDTLCMNCDTCYDLYFEFGIIAGLVSGEISPLSARQQIQAWKYAKHTDIAIKSLND